MSRCEFYVVETDGECGRPGASVVSVRLHCGPVAPFAACADHGQSLADDLAANGFTVLSLEGEGPPAGRPEAEAGGPAGVSP